MSASESNGVVTKGRRPRHNVRKIPESEFRNPYSHHIDWTPPKYLKVALGAVILFPIRMCLLIGITVCVYLVALPTSWGMGKSPTSHLKPWQRFVVERFLRGILGNFMALVMGFYSPTVIGKRASHLEAPFSLVAPHTSIVDVILTGIYTQGSYVAMSSLKAMPFIGTLMSVSEMIWVDRDPGNRDGTAVSPREALERRLNSPGRWQSIVMFPEGTVHVPGVLTNFRPGPFYHGVPVQPVVYRYKSSEEWTTWVDPSHGMILSFFHIMCQFQNEFEVEFLPVYVPNDEEKRDAHLYANNVRASIAKAINVPVTEHSFEDTMLAEYGTTLGLPLSAGLVEFRKLKQQLSLSYRPLLKLLKHFAKLDGDKDGYVTEADMSRGIPWPFPAHAKEWFAACDTSHNGRISFREYAIAYGDVIVPLSRDDSILRAAFQALSEAPGSECTTSAGYTPWRITSTSIKRAFGKVDGFVPGSHMSFYCVVCPDNQPCGYETFTKRIRNKPDLLVLLEGVLQEQWHQTQPSADLDGMH